MDRCLKCLFKVECIEADKNKCRKARKATLFKLRPFKSILFGGNRKSYFWYRIHSLEMLAYLELGGRFPRTRWPFLYFTFQDQKAHAQFVDLQYLSRWYLVQFTLSNGFTIYHVDTDLVRLNQIEFYYLSQLNDSIAHRYIN